jgi:hypothetical protein
MKRLFGALTSCALVLLLGAVASSTPLLVTTRYLMVYVNGNARQGASAGASTGNYRLVGTMADGSVLVSYDDAGATNVELISPALGSRMVKSFPRLVGAFISPSVDGFVEYDGGLQLLRRYDLQGAAIGSPVASAGAKDALGIGQFVVVSGNGRLSEWDTGGRLRHEVILDGTSLVALGADRFAVIDLPDREVRVYDTNLDLKARMRFPVRPPRMLAAGRDGSLAILAGTPSCVGSDVEVDVYDDPTASSPRARIQQNVATAIAVAIDKDQVYVANATCNRDGDGSIAVFGRDGSPGPVLGNVGSPTGVLPLAAAAPR